MIAFNHVVPVLNLSVFNVRRAPAFAFEQSKRATIGGRFIRVDESRDLPLLHVVEDFTQKPVCSFAVTTGGEIKIDSAAPAVDGPVQIRPAAIDLHVGFIHVPRAKIGRVTPVPAQPFFHFRRITLNPAVNRGVIDIHSAFSQHLLQLTVTDAVFAVPAYGPQNDVTLKMPAFEWVHVQLHQQKGMISLSPPTICNSARICTGPSTAGAALSIFISPPVVTAKLHTGFWVKSSTT
ncbi:putative p12 protein [Acinetobacter baumannii 25493_5]|nr:putative p12 protein [Acinetobacter baumannii 25493_5]